jgi:hypothetical protein
MSATFRLKPEHIAILRALSWEWDDSERWGGPSVDPKRPFGNSIGVELDIAEAIGTTPEGEEDGEPCLTEDQEERCLGLYDETLPALLVILSARSFRPGLYARDGDAGEWVWVRR